MNDDMFEDTLEEAAGFLENLEGTAVRLYVHNDADGLTAGALMAFTLRCLEIPTRLRVLNTETELLKEDLDGPTVVVDMGSGILNKLRNDHPVLVVDHHEISSKPSDNVLLVNPREHGVDGGTEASASTVAYLLCRRVVKVEETCLPKAALIGAYGDNQAGKRGVRGLNKVPEEDGERREIIEIRDPAYWVFGRASMAVGEIVERVSGTSVREALEARFGDLDVAPVDLSREDEAEIIREHRELLKGRKKKELESKTGRIHVFDEERPLKALRDPLETATLLNACGRYGEGWAGVLIAMGSWDPLQLAKKLRSKHKAIIREVLSRLNRGEGIKDRDNMVVIDGYELEIPHTVVGIITQFVCEERERVTVGVTKMEDGLVKVSIRCPENSDVDAAEVIKEAANRVDGEGGGHERAAGAEVPEDRLEDFLLELEKLL
ncbi:DHH family phosphoesterase [Methanopyrus sp.]